MDWKSEADTCRLCVQKQFGKAFLEEFLSCPLEVLTERYHFGFGTWIRNEFLSGKSPDEWNGMGRDEMSAWIMRYWYEIWRAE